LKRAACLLFSDRPERYVSGAWIKIGFFVTDDDLRYQDEIHGNLFEQVEKTLDLLHVKYFKAYISYKGIQRRETFLFPEGALREALLNAIVHKDYSSGVPIQISVYDDKIVLWNPGQLPPGWTLERLLGKHPSNPPNPLLANAFFRSGYIESWGRGIEKIRRECREHDIEPPVYDFEMSGLMLTFHANLAYLQASSSESRTNQRLGEKLGEKLGARQLEGDDNSTGQVSEHQHHRRGEEHPVSESSRPDCAHGTSQGGILESKGGSILSTIGQPGHAAHQIKSCAVPVGSLVPQPHFERAIEKRRTIR
jgi:ATP-dependent DNA helicase RecG